MLVRVLSLPHICPPPLWASFKWGLACRHFFGLGASLHSWAGRLPSQQSHVLQSSGMWVTHSLVNTGFAGVQVWDDALLLTPLEWLLPVEDTGKSWPACWLSGDPRLITSFDIGNKYEGPYESPPLLRAACACMKDADLCSSTRHQTGIALALQIGFCCFFPFHLKSFAITPTAIYHSCFISVLPFPVQRLLITWQHFSLSLKIFEIIKTQFAPIAAAVGQGPVLRLYHLLASVKYLHHPVYFSCLFIWICSDLTSWWAMKGQRGWIPAGSAHGAVCLYFWVSGALWRLLLPTTGWVETAQE